MGKQASHIVSPQTPTCNDFPETKAHVRVRSGSLISMGKDGELDERLNQMPGRRNAL